MRENYDFVVSVNIITLCAHATFSWAAQHTVVCHDHQRQVLLHMLCGSTTLECLVGIDISKLKDPIIKQKLIVVNMITVTQCTLAKTLSFENEEIPNCCTLLSLFCAIFNPIVTLLLRVLLCF